MIKRRKIDVLRRTLLWVGRTTEGLFHLAGEGELAERIRTSTRRPARPPEEAADEPPAGAAGADDESSSESVTPTGRRSDGGSEQKAFLRVYREHTEESSRWT